MSFMKTASSALPRKAKSLARRIVFRNRHWAHSDLKEFGTVQDLYYWVSDSNKDTILVLQNYYSAFYPHLNTATKGTVSVNDQNGSILTRNSFDLVDKGAVKLRVSDLLDSLPVMPRSSFGTLEVNLAIPSDVTTALRDYKSFYFWDRFYIGYSNNLGQTCFVHGVDKTNIYREGASESLDWYKVSQGHSWAPETPVDINDYARFDVVLINRTSRAADTTLTLFDEEDQSLSWHAEIPAKGVRRFELDQDNTSKLDPTQMRMRVTGMATRFGRPLVFKEFPNGAISAMHC